MNVKLLVTKTNKMLKLNKTIKFTKHQQDIKAYFSLKKIAAESWDSTTKILEKIQNMVDNDEITEDNQFKLYSEVFHWEGIMSLKNDKEHMHRLLYCQQLCNQIMNKNKED